MYRVVTIGELEAPPRAPLATGEPVVNAQLMAAVSLAGALVGGLGVWAFYRFGKRRR